jgi:hypothetical protein
MRNTFIVRRLGLAVGAAALLVFPTFALASRGNPVSHAKEIFLDVVPQSQITYDGSCIKPCTVSSEGDTFVFPSLLKGEGITEPYTFTTTNTFLKSDNEFLSTTNTFPWPFKRRVHPISVSRGTGENANALIIAIDTNTLTELGKLSYPDFRRLQGDFSDWILDQGGCSWFVSKNRRFNQYDCRMRSFWLDLLSREALLSTFANNHPFNGPIPCTFKGYVVPKNLKDNDDDGATHVNAWPIRQNGWLRITWGGTALYPFPSGPNQAVMEDGISRQTSAGETLVQIFGVDGHYALESADLVLNAKPGSKGSAENSNAYPYPVAWLPMLGHFIVPIFNEWDLHNSLLLKKYHSEDRPPYLFLVTPTTYVKADCTTYSQNDEDPNNVIAYTADSSQGAAVDIDIPHLFRRCIILGSDSPDPSKALSDLISGLQNIVSKRPDDSNTNSYRAATFNNQTSVEIVHYFFYNGRQYSRPETQGASWLQALSTFPPEQLASAKSLSVYRPYSQFDFGPKFILHFHFNSWNDAMLQSVKTADDDSFHTDL